MLAAKTLILKTPGHFVFVSLKFFYFIVMFVELNLFDRLRNRAISMT